MACRPDSRAAITLRVQVVDEHALGGHDAGGLDQVLVDGGFGLEQQDRRRRSPWCLKCAKKAWRLLRISKVLTGMLESR